MKGFILLSLIVLAGTVHAFPVSPGSSIDILPNIQVTAFYGLTDKITSMGILSNMLRYKAVDLNLGLVEKNGKGVWNVSLSLAIDRIPFKDVQYLWGSAIKTSIGIWAGFDFAIGVVDYGFTASIIRIAI